jgi:pimeloyl-ACP methyl ester carboxylesterase
MIAFRSPWRPAMFRPMLSSWRCRSGIRAEVVFGEDDEVGTTPAERSTLEVCPTTRLHLVPNCGHMLPNQKPDWVAELIVETVATSRRPTGTT